MMKYRVYCQHPSTKLLHLSLQVDTQGAATVLLQLPSWRPGRYELQHFAKNIFSFEVRGTSGQALPFHKVTKDRWEVKTQGEPYLMVHYTYYAAQMDAGGSWVDEDQVYINWINCALMVLGRKQEPYEVSLELPEGYRLGTALPNRPDGRGYTLHAANFFELADSPCIASPHLQHRSYMAGGHTFHIWLQGRCQPKWEQTIQEFKAFTEAQIALLGEFPNPDYHFLFQILPYKHYHGVEHRNSTVIVLGPAEAFHTETLYNDFLGVSSHELYHTWNIMRLRPAELTPYDLTQENYFETGFVAEGITTYYGDLVLARSGVWKADDYIKELDILLKRHFENFARGKASLSEASYDLWLDGYSPRLPKRMLSIYVEGALTALILDLLVRQESNDALSLDSIMRDLWERFGRTEAGYALAEYEQVVSQYYSNAAAYFKACIHGKESLLPWLREAFTHVGLVLEEKRAEKAEERLFGFRVGGLSHGCYTVQYIDPASPAYKLLHQGDEIIAVNGQKCSEHFGAQLGEAPTLTIFHQSLLKTVVLPSVQGNFFSTYTIKRDPDASEGQRASFERWVGN